MQWSVMLQGRIRLGFNPVIMIATQPDPGDRVTDRSYLARVAGRGELWYSLNRCGVGHVSCCVVGYYLRH